MSLFLNLKPGDQIRVDKETVLTCIRSRAGQLRLEIAAPLDVLIQHVRADGGLRARSDAEPGTP
jgi:sRNA-binding carbon storage regulator CsrA